MIFLTFFVEQSDFFVNNLLMTIYGYQWNEKGYQSYGSSLAID